jgi:putative aminopeptidase FrvX
MPQIRNRTGGVHLNLLRRLCEAVAVSGAEREVREVVLEALRPAEQDFRVDALGNLLITKPRRGGRPPRVMLDAHMDEVGFMLVAEDGDGLYEFTDVGGVDARNLIGKQVVVGSKRTPGVIGAKPIHRTTTEELKRAIGIETLRVDLGPGGKAKPGERGTFAPNFRRSGPSVMSKALDNRLGVATLIEVLRAAPSNVELMAAFTVQEEVGLRGAGVAARYFRPDVAIVIEATPANDLPMQREGENTFYNTRLGLGPAIYVSERSTIDDPRLTSLVMEVARRSRIPYQVRQAGGGGTDAGAIQRVETGIPVVTIAVPHRYPHSAMSVARIEDWRNTLRLLLATLGNLTPELLRRRR